jgi:hypothetical protein
VQLAHALEDLLAGLGILVEPERRILLAHLAEDLDHLLLVGARLGLDREAEHRLARVDPLEEHGLLRITQRVAGRREPEAGEQRDLARLGDVDAALAFASTSNTRATRSISSDVPMRTA